MGTRTTFQGKVRSYGGRDPRNEVTPGVSVLSVIVSCDPTQTDATDAAAKMRIGTSATSGEFFVLPKGAVPHSVTTINASTGGTNPTVDIGSSDDSDGIFNEVDCDTKGSIQGGGGALVVPGGLASDTTVTAIAGSSAATGGTSSFVITYTVTDDGTSGTTPDGGYA